MSQKPELRPPDHESAREKHRKVILAALAKATKETANR